MILVDANIPLYAENPATAHHERARRWWDQVLSGNEPVGLCWPVVTAYIRIATNARVFVQPLTLVQACHRVQSWFDQPCVRMVAPTPSHWQVLAELLTTANANANLVPDAHLAALAIEHNCEFYSADTDFSRFPKLKWRNPLR